MFKIAEDYMYGGVISSVEVRGMDGPSNHVVRCGRIDESKCLRMNKVSNVDIDD